MSDHTAVVPAPGTGPRRSPFRTVTRGRLIASVVVAAAIFCIVVAFIGAGDPATKVNLRPATVVTVFPSEGARVLRQERIGAQLADGFTGELQIDGVDIPLDQLIRPQDPIGVDAATAAAKGLAGLNEVSFTPAPGKEIERFRTGDHTATVLFWDRASSSRDRADRYSWAFSVT